MFFNELELLIGSFSEKLVAQTYDGAAVLRGVNSGVQTRVKEVYGNAHFLHCYAHQLNLVMQRATSHHKQARIFFNNLSGIPAFFSQSSHRTKALENATNGRRIPRPSSTRWNFKSRTVNQVHELKENIIECCTKLEASSSRDTGSAAGGIKRLLRDPDFLFWLEFFSKIMPHVDILYNQIQARGIDSFKASKAVQAFKSSVQVARNDCSTINVTGHGATSRPRYAEGRSVVAKEICDVILSQSEERFSFAGHLEASRLFDSNCFNEYSKIFPLTTLENAVVHYPMLNKCKLRAELAALYARPDLSCFKSLTEFLQLINSLNWVTTFCETSKLLKILITTPMTTSESERCFSTLKRIKSFLRSTMGNERLSALAMLSIESKLVSEIKDFFKKSYDLPLNLLQYRKENSAEYLHS